MKSFRNCERMARLLRFKVSLARRSSRFTVTYEE
jgi:hypothetical protein